MARLLYVGQQVADELRDGVFQNLGRYIEGDFLELEAAGDWRIPLSINANLELLEGLSAERGSDEEISNSLLVGQALAGLTPTLARENRIWVRLSHVECLGFARNRWISREDGDEKIVDSIRTHFFATTLTACRDDHAISRLWWSYRIAKQTMPDDPERALKMILARADIRLSLVERPGIGARPKLARGIIRLLERSEPLRRTELSFRAFMKRVNLLGAGIAFEIWSESALDSFLDRCLEAVSPAGKAEESNS